VTISVASVVGLHRTPIAWLFSDSGIRRRGALILFLGIMLVHGTLPPSDGLR
jgi:hypothetical protein